MALRQGNDHADLLRERRRELGLPVRPRRCCCASVVVDRSSWWCSPWVERLAVAVVAAREGQLDQHIAQLLPIEQRVNSARQRLQTIRQH